MGVLLKSTLREIGDSLGRYLAILVIIALGVGFFAGLRACRPAFTGTAGAYFDAQNLYDLRLLSSLGFSGGSAEELSRREEIACAEGALFEDVLVTTDGGEMVLRVHSITEKLNRLTLISGRLPAYPWECVLDADAFGPDSIGQTLPFSKNNKEETLDAFTEPDLMVVGTVRSPLYISKDRGNASIGDGRIDAFAFVPRDAFTADYCTELYLTLADRPWAYSAAYEDRIAAYEETAEALAETLSESRYEELLSTGEDQVADARAELADARAELDEQKEEAVQEMAGQMAAYGLTVTEGSDAYGDIRAAVDEAFQPFEEELADGAADLAQAEAELADLEPPSSTVLTRSENAGYASFDQDATIIENISVVFPVFFFLVAALVCATTMKRMVDEQRTQIGVWKALGYRQGAISGKYLLYAGSAGLIGALGGFFAGTGTLPGIFWTAYRSIYDFSASLSYSFDGGMFAFSLTVAMLCTVGVAWACCRRTLREVPASILRPKTPKNGKRILLERFTPLWRRLSFLYKVSLRNTIRYRQRFLLMILGISGCTALVLTGFGIRDSIQNVAEYQYGEVVRYDADISFTKALSPAQREAFARDHAQTLRALLFLSRNNASLLAGGRSKEATLTLALGELQDFMVLHAGEEPVAVPGDGEIVLSRGLAEALQLEPGSAVTLADEDFHTVPVTVAGVFDNYIGKYAFVSEKTVEDLFGQVEVNGAYAAFPEGADQGRAYAALAGDEQVGYVTLNRDTRETIESSFASLDMIVLLIILCAGALAFIVLFNLININISERNREIATLRVLGFFNRESAAYVFREVNMLTATGTLLGLPLGKLLHAFAMSQIRPEGMSFDIRIAPVSYLFSFLMTVFFAALVKFAMGQKLKKIHMAEALKSVE